MNRTQWSYEPEKFPQAPWQLVLCKTDKGAICQVRCCRSPKRTAFAFRGGKLKSYLCQICHKCHSRRWRANNPVGCAFHCIKSRAKRRGQEFGITLEWLKEFVADTGYADCRGRKPANLHIDRIIATTGYIPGNLQIITASANCSKGVTTDKQLHNDPF